MLSNKVQRIREFAYVRDKRRLKMWADVITGTRFWWGKSRECDELICGMMYHLKLK